MNRAELVVAGQAGGERGIAHLHLASLLDKSENASERTQLSMVSRASNGGKPTFPYKWVMTMCT